MTTSERRLRKVIGKWVKILGLEDWAIAVELVSQDMLGVVNGMDVAADCLAQWEYQRATLRFVEPLEGDRELESLVIHELQHVMLNELRREHRMPNEERAATMLAKAFMRIAA